jgi:hypothetical protein
VPVLLGTNIDEYAAFLCPSYNYSTFSLSDYQTFLSNSVNNNSMLASAIFNAYNPVNYSSPWAALVQEQSDTHFKCDAREVQEMIPE